MAPGIDALPRESPNTAAHAEVVLSFTRLAAYLESEHSDLSIGRPRRDGPQALCSFRWGHALHTRKPLR